jgi:peptide/nickel transport system substrate-binding protein
VRGGRLPVAGLLALLLAAAQASSAARARLGGTLSLGLVNLAPPGPDTSGDSPEASTARALLALPLCRLLPEAVPVLATVLRPAGGAQQEVVVAAVAGARFPDGTGLSARDVADAWRRLAGTQSPYMSLLSPVANLEEALAASALKPEAPLHLRLAYAWPDFEASLCHPAFTPVRLGAPGHSLRGVGLYAEAAEGRFLASRGAPGGPPFPAALGFSTLPARAAQRLLQSGEVHAVLGEAGGTDTPSLLFATYLVYRPGSLPEGVLAALSSMDLEALVRTFVPGPAVAMHALLPPSLLDWGPAPAPPKGKPVPVPAMAARGFTLGYEVGLPEHRAVAERLQVLLHDAGYKVRLSGGTREGLARARLRGELEAALVSVLLPPLAAPALAVVLGLSEDAALLGRELPGLGSVADAGARAARVRERAAQLQPGLPLIPLFARGLRAQLSPALLDVRRDGFGLLVLDDAWLAH